MEMISVYIITPTHDCDSYVEKYTKGVIVDFTTFRIDND